MTLRRVLWIAIPVLLVVVLAGGGALAWLLVRRAGEQRLVVLRDDQTVQLLDSSGAARLLAENALTSGYSFPAPSPDGRQLAFVSRESDGSAIVVLEIASGARRELYRSQEHTPIDLAWSPDGKYLVFLLGTQLTAQIVPTDGSQPARLVAAGSPSFFAWSPDSASLLLHLGGHMAQGGHMAMFQPGQELARPLLSDPGLFQAPAWSLDGRHFFYVAQPPIESEQPSIQDLKGDIMRVSADGKDPVRLVREEQSDLRIIRSPVSDQLAYMVRGVAGFGPLKLVDGQGGEARTLSRPGEHVTAFFWSPDGAQIAYLTHAGEFTAEGQRSWHVVSAAGGAVRDLGEFTPSQSFAGLQIFFDAYIFSFSPWSPDGRQLAYGASDGVYVIDIASGSAQKRSDGTLAMWVGGQ